MAEPETVAPPKVDISAYLEPATEEEAPAIQETVWEKDAALTAVFLELATAKSIALEEDVEVIPLNSRLLDDDTASPHPVTRLEQRHVVDYAFKVSRENIAKRSVAICIRGSPGIGKSWSALLYIRKLMGQTEDRRPVIFERGRSPEARETCIITPPSESDGGGGTWTVYRLKQGKVPTEWRDCGVIDVVIDPAQFPKDQRPVPSPLIAARGHLFIPVSPDDAHLGGSHKTSSLFLQLVLGPWPLKQLEVGFPYMRFKDPTSVYNQNRGAYKETIENMREYYYVVGGLPRYLDKDKAIDRMDEITPAKAANHAQVLLDALVEGKDFSDSGTEKVLTRFFTLRAGEDQNGYNPNRRYATLDFVSPGAIKAAGKILLEKIHKDSRWRGTDDASDIGLAFERVVLVFLAQGTVGMKSLGIKTRCKQLFSRPREEEAEESAPTNTSPPVQFVLNGSRDKIEETPNNLAFETEVQANGKGLSFSENVLTSNKKISLPPDGYSNFDGMAGSDMGFNATLQKNHSVSGPEYIRQRQAFGLQDEKFAHIFVVPPDRFDNNWFYFQNFSWTGDDAAINRKRRKVKAGGTARSAPSVSQSEKQRARESMLQFVLTLEIEDEEEVKIGEKAQADAMVE